MSQKDTIVNASIMALGAIVAAAIGAWATLKTQGKDEKEPTRKTEHVEATSEPSAAITSGTEHDVLEQNGANVEGIAVDGALEEAEVALEVAGGAVDAASQLVLTEITGDDPVPDLQSPLAKLIRLEPASVKLEIVPLKPGAIKSRHLLTITLKAANRSDKELGLGVYGRATTAVVSSIQFAPHRNDYPAPRGVCFMPNPKQCPSTLADERLLIPPKGERTLVFRTVYEAPPGDLSGVESAANVEVQLSYYLVDDAGKTVDEAQVLYSNLTSIERL